MKNVIPRIVLPAFIVIQLGSQVLISKVFEKPIRPVPQTRLQEASVSSEPWKLVPDESDQRMTKALTRFAVKLP